MEKQAITQLFRLTFGADPASMQQLTGSGSNRAYFRITDSGGKTCIGVVGKDLDENKAFCTLTRLFGQYQLPVPELLATENDYSAYLQSDLGTTALFDLLKQGRDSGGNYSDEEQALLHKAMQTLCLVQHQAAHDEVYDACYPLREMDRQSIHFDLNYFKYLYLKLTGTEFNEVKLQADFEQLAEDLLAVPEKGFQYRDYQARNIMVRDGQFCLIDYQGGRKGPVYYDVASFLYQASAHYSPTLRQQLFRTYLQTYSERNQLQVQDIEADATQKLRLFAFFRTLQVLGAYGFRGLWEKKAHFIQSIPPALANLGDLLAEGAAQNYPYLQQICHILAKGEGNKVATSS